jgi:hypothetical protein
MRKSQARRTFETLSPTLHSRIGDVPCQTECSKVEERLDDTQRPQPRPLHQTRMNQPGQVFHLMIRPRRAREDGIQLDGRFGQEVDQGDLPDRGGLVGRHKIHDADQEDPFDRTGECREVERTRVVFFPAARRRGCDGCQQSVLR